MRELALFAGACGGVLGTKLLGWKVIGYVEWNEYCQQLIAQRIADGVLDRAPVFTDVREFIQSGAARQYRGFADVVTAGFPCQPFSVAGKRAGANDERNMWPATIDCIRMVRPRYAFLENVPGLLASGYFGTILGGLAESGYDARWRILSAAEVGAPHLRKRLWIVAVARSAERRQKAQPKQIGDKGQDFVQAGREQGTDGLADLCASVAYTYETGLSQPTCPGFGGIPQTAGECARGKFGRGIAAPGGWWEAEPALGRMADGYANRVAELKAAGNAQVPLVAATAWRLLTETEREVA